MFGDGSPTTIVHRLLLLLQLAQMVLELSTARHKTVLVATLARVDLQQRPDAPTNGTSFSLWAVGAMPQQLLHLVAIGREAVAAAGGVYQQLQV